MDFLTHAIVFIFGASMGSFLNVVIYRYHSSMSPLNGRSKCFSCGKMLHGYELIPIISFLIQLGRCRGCKGKISWQYPIVELCSGLVWVLVFLLNTSISETVLLLIIFSILLIIAVYDMRHQIIPDELVASFAVLSLIKLLIINHSLLITIASGFLFFTLFWSLWFFSKGRLMGLGDGKLVLGIGWFLGLSAGGSALILAFWIGAAWGIIMLGLQKLGGNLISRKLSLKSEIPFGPFLILGVFIVYFLKINFFA